MMTAQALPARSGNVGTALRLGAAAALCAAGLSCRGPADDRPARPGDTPAPVAPASAYEAQRARELSERAGAFLRGTMAGLAPGAVQEKAAADVQYAVGDLFKCGRDVAVAGFLIREGGADGGHETIRSPGLVFYLRKGGQWQLRNSFAAEGTVTPVAMLNLGRLAPGHYRAEVTVTGPGVRESFGMGFRVEGRR